MADVNAGLHLDKEYRNLYNVFTAEAVARSVAVLSGVLIATVPLVLAFFPWASFLFVFPHWAMALLFVTGGSVCATGIYFPLKSILISAANRRSENMWINENHLNAEEEEDDIEEDTSEEDASEISSSSSVNAAGEAEIVGPLHEFTIGISTKMAFVKGVFLNCPTSLIYVGNAVEVLFVTTCKSYPLLITKDLMENRLRIYNNESQFYSGKFYASYIVVDSLSHMLNDEFYVSHDWMRIKYQNCDFGNAQIQENPTQSTRTRYLFRNCVITSAVFKFLKMKIAMCICFDNCKFMEIANGVELESKRVRFIGQGNTLNKGVLNALKNIQGTIIFEGLRVETSMLDIKFCDPGISLFFRNCIYGENFVQQIALKNYSVNYTFAGLLDGGGWPDIFSKSDGIHEFDVRRPSIEAIFNLKYGGLKIYCKNTEINRDTFRVFQNSSVNTLEIQHCTFNFGEDVDINLYKFRSSHIRLNECEIRGEVLRAFSGQNTSIWFSSCVFCSLAISHVQIQYCRVIIDGCDGVENMVNFLRTAPNVELNIWRRTLNTDEMYEDTFSKCSKVKLSCVKFTGNNAFPMIRSGNGEMSFSSENLPNQYGPVDCRHVKFCYLTISDLNLQSLHGKVENISFEECENIHTLSLPSELSIGGIFYFKNNLQCEEIYIGNPTKIRGIEIENCKNLKKITTSRGACRIENGVLQLIKAEGWFKNIEARKVRIRKCPLLATGGKVVAVT